ncbi:MAG: hypothetical protein EAZ89_10645 [Bacteroidetes bacterium]|nr:MAG: hypothetical protein EAZ89_10645 [Bacteroidota bacterium]
MKNALVLTLMMIVALAAPVRMSAGVAAPALSTSVAAPAKPLSERQLKLKEKVQKMVEKRIKVKTSPDADIDPLLKKSITFAVIAVLVSVVSSVLAYAALGSLIYGLGYLVALVFWILALYYLLKWLDVV